MGTNFYAKIKVSKWNKAKLQSYIDTMQQSLNNSDMVEFDNTLDDLTNDFSYIKKETVIHLGKRSAGWAFLWDLNNMKYYEPSYNSIVSFLKENNCTIECEYGKKYSIDDFFNKEIGYCLHPSERPITKEELEASTTIPDVTKQYIIENYINKNKPYYQYCTCETYREMTGASDDLYWRDYNNFRYKCQPFASKQINSFDTDFVSKDNLRFAIYTDFS